MRLSFFDDENINHLYPLTLTRPAADLRCGLLTVAEKWVHDLHATEHGYETRPYLREKYPPVENADVKIAGNLLPSAALTEAVQLLKPGETLQKEGIVLAQKTGEPSSVIEFTNEIHRIQRPFQLFSLLQTEIPADYSRITSNRTSSAMSSTVTIIGPHQVFLEPGAKAEACTINTTNGPVYLGKNAEIMEGSHVRGPMVMGEGAVLKLGTKVYGPTALGPYCVVGGEVNNISMQGYSNKGHDGFLGNAVLGEWCNIGADSNCSNLKNNYEDVKVWNYASGRFDKSGLQFCGLIMGDHSKCGINTMFNTGTVVGVSANIFGAGFPRQFVPDFAWGGATGFITYKLDAACKTASLVMPRRKKEFNDTEKAILEKVFEMTAEWRNWE
ncbi:MAG: glucose-1-phosphate thymidylyltransferase [Bacteroidetes bacterium]|nr:glucose-1-phosphate thymidylyltransferase [Bacteroidota bacterium]